jgi:molybdopterin/thiamine biosynthesis adenylyltransferase
MNVSDTAALAMLDRVLVVGAGGLSCPVLSVLAASGAHHFTIVDDDAVDTSNLHRQVLYTERDVGRLKADAACETLRNLHPGRVDARSVIDRFAPDNAAQLVEGHTLVIDGSDNFATKFLVADAAKLAGVPSVHAGVVRFAGWALGVSPFHGACLRCVFEDIPRGMPETCAVAGVLGPVVGVLGGVQALLAVDLARDAGRHGSRLWTFDAKTAVLRSRPVLRRMDCPLCTGQIRDLNLDRYLGHCAA